MGSLFPNREMKNGPITSHSDEMTGVKDHMKNSHRMHHAVQLALVLMLIASSICQSSASEEEDITDEFGAELVRANLKRNRSNLSESFSVESQESISETYGSPDHSSFTGFREYVVSNSHPGMRSTFVSRQSSLLTRHRTTDILDDSDSIEKAVEYDHQEGYDILQKSEGHTDLSSVFNVQQNALVQRTAMLQTSNSSVDSLGWNLEHTRLSTSSPNLSKYRFTSSNTLLPEQALVECNSPRDTFSPKAKLSVRFAIDEQTDTSNMRFSLPKSSGTMTQLQKLCRRLSLLEAKPEARIRSYSYTFQGVSEDFDRTLERIISTRRYLYTTLPRPTGQLWYSKQVVLAVFQEMDRDMHVEDWDDIIHAMLMMDEESLWPADSSSSSDASKAYMSKDMAKLIYYLYRKWANPRGYYRGDTSNKSTSSAIDPRLDECGEIVPLVSVGFPDLLFNGLIVPLLTNDRKAAKLVMEPWEVVLQREPFRSFEKFVPVKPRNVINVSFFQTLLWIIEVHNALSDAEIEGSIFKMTAKVDPQTMVAQQSQLHETVYRVSISQFMSLALNSSADIANRLKWTGMPVELADIIKVSLDSVPDQRLRLFLEQPEIWSLLVARLHESWLIGDFNEEQMRQIIAETMTIAQELAAKEFRDKSADVSK